MERSNCFSIILSSEDSDSHWPDISKVRLEFGRLCTRSKMFPLALLAARSEEGVFYDSWRKGGGEKIVRLPDVTLEVLNMYEVYLGWWDFRQIHAPDLCTRESNLKDKHAEYMLFIDLYKLGCGKLDDVKLRNYAAWRCRRLWNHATCSLSRRSSRLCGQSSRTEISCESYSWISSSRRVATNQP